MLRKILAKLLVSRLKWHDFKSIHPVSDSFGFDRGSPIDRYYIESFLRANSHHIRGTVLEIAENHYSKKFGTAVERYEVLHVEKSKNATIVGDLTKPELLPADMADCFICTQVYNFIFDFQKAIEGSYRLLKPGGVLLATVSGISQISRYDADRWGHYWSFYPQGITEAIKKVFTDSADITVTTYGNSLTAVCFLKGIAMEELKTEELDYVDQNYPVTITIVARKK